MLTILVRFVFLLTTTLAIREEFLPVLKINNNELKKIVSQFWDLDENAVRGNNFKLNFQKNTNLYQRVDVAPFPLFGFVKPSILTKETYKAYINLMNNIYNPNVGVIEMEKEGSKYVNDFCNAVMETKIGNHLYNYLNRFKYPIAQNKNVFKNTIKQIWFGLYSRSRGAKDSSGFEHVFMGEFKNNQISGLHNWLRLYYLESKKEKENFDYMGLIDKVSDCTANIQFKWRNIIKPGGSFFIGTSPEFDFSVYTLCFLAKRKEKICEIEIKGCLVRIEVHDSIMNGHVYVGSAFPIVNSREAKCKTSNDLTISNKEIQDFVNEIYKFDENAVTNNYLHLNFQKDIHIKDKRDNAPEPLFKYVNSSLFKKPTYKAYLALMDNYIPEVGKEENITLAKDREIKNFFKAIMKTRIGSKLFKFLKSKEYKHTKTKYEFEKLLKQIWFGLYTRSKGVSDSSGFEHVFMGEIKKKKVSGLHNWIRLYHLEKNNKTEKFDYMGYLEKSSGFVASIKYRWRKGTKQIGSFFIGTSPEFDFSIYTLCFLSKRKSGTCNFEINGCPIKVITHELKYKGNVYIGSSYPLIGKHNSKFSHVKIIDKNVAMVYGSDEPAQEEDGVKYTVKHLEILKVPKNFNESSLSNIIITPSNTAMCGVDFLNVSDSYILAGAFNPDKTLTIKLCGGLTYNGNKVDSILKLKKYRQTINC
uniref:Endoribonuclease n=1 Tax=Parastrongyloides trichosuri TaxID=131310 RepID=A0A0N5A709_PARTI